jgi:hypothetical protein
MYCTYLTIYFGENLPRRYIGSSSVKRIKQGYNGSVSSKKWKEIYEREQIENKNLFKTRILSYHKTAKEAREKERILQIKYNVVKSQNYYNESLAQPNGFFGRDVSGNNNPMYGSNRTGEKHKGGENISKALKAYFLSEAGNAERKRRSREYSGEGNPMYGKQHSERLKKSRSLMYAKEGNPMYGKAHSETSKEKMSQRKRGMPAHNKGVPMTEIQKQKLRKPKKRYLVNNSIIVENAKEFCEKNNLNYSSFTSSAKHSKIYKGMLIEIL